MSRSQRAPNTLLFVFQCRHCEAKFKFVDFDSPVYGNKYCFCTHCQKPIAFRTFTGTINQVSNESWNARLIFTAIQLNEVEPTLLFLPTPAIVAAPVILRVSELPVDFERQLRLKWWSELENSILDYESSLPSVGKRLIDKLNHWTRDIKYFFTRQKEVPIASTDARLIDLSKLSACYQNWRTFENTPAGLEEYEPLWLQQAGRLLDLAKVVENDTSPAGGLQSLHRALVKLDQEMRLRKIPVKPLDQFSTELEELAGKLFGSSWRDKPYPPDMLSVRETREQYELNLKRLMQLNVEGFTKAELYQRLGLFEEAAELLENEDFGPEFRYDETVSQCFSQLRKKIKNRDKKPFRFDIETDPSKMTV